MANANTVFNNGHALLVFKTGQAIGKKWSWCLDARNLTNKKYAATTKMAANDSISLGDGRAVYVGVEARFD